MVVLRHPLSRDQRNSSHVGLFSELDFSKLSSVGHHVLVLNTHNTTTPVSSEALVLVELSAEVLGQDLKVLVVLLLDRSESDAGSSLRVDKLAETCLALNEAVGDTLLSAKGRQECQDLKGINVVSNHN